MTYAPENVARWREEWAARYRAGATIMEIAHEANMRPASVHEQLRAAGVEMRRPAPRMEWRDKLPALLDQGLTYAAIGERLGKHPSIVSKAARQLGLRGATR